MEEANLSGWLLVIGSVTFGIGAGNPYLVRAWTAPRDMFLAIVARHPLAWRVTHVLFIGGTLLTTAGLAAMILVVPDGWPRGLAVAGVAIFGISATLWIVSLVYRLAVTPTTADALAETGAVDPWISILDRLNAGLFKAFIVIGFTGLAAIGVATTAGGPVPAPLGWATAALSGLAVIGLLLSGDMPPFTVYLAPLAFGIALLVGS